ncbi:hypothetical protein FISHEDRAFT_74274 [Fistulina hepatica ATCC 64428]|uniref:Uncharacterized protein n=1 Tax=Fistulina hepatica ATCC 64428 TaxID=1128425 RepID=A0A0D7AB02_9AGAR|nr:hypothetical protein FISHEDRAFT_74274 [Fistulina hepatica ATCC 64428]
MFENILQDIKLCVFNMPMSTAASLAQSVAAPGIRLGEEVASQKLLGYFMATLPDDYTPDKPELLDSSVQLIRVPILKNPTNLRDIDPANLTKLTKNFGELAENYLGHTLRYAQAFLIDPASLKVPTELRVTNSNALAKDLPKLQVVPGTIITGLSGGHRRWYLGATLKRVALELKKQESLLSSLQAASASETDIGVIQTVIQELKGRADILQHPLIALYDLNMQENLEAMAFATSNQPDIQVKDSNSDIIKNAALALQKDPSMSFLEQQMAYSSFRPKERLQNMLLQFIFAKQANIPAHTSIYLQWLWYSEILHFGGIWGQPKSYFTPAWMSKFWTVSADLYIWFLLYFKLLLIYLCAPGKKEWFRIPSIAISRKEILDDFLKDLSLSNQDRWPTYTVPNGVVANLLLCVAGRAYKVHLAEALRQNWGQDSTQSWLDKLEIYHDAIQEELEVKAAAILPDSEAIEDKALVELVHRFQLLRDSHLFSSARLSPLGMSKSFILPCPGLFVDVGDMLYKNSYGLKMAFLMLDPFALSVSEKKRSEGKIASLSGIIPLLCGASLVNGLQFGENWTNTNKLFSIVIKHTFHGLLPISSLPMEEQDIPQRMKTIKEASIYEELGEDQVKKDLQGLRTVWQKAMAAKATQFMKEKKSIDFMDPVFRYLIIF